MAEQLIQLGHSPDPDDAFMFYALAKDKIETGPYRFQHILRDIETLNGWAAESRLEVTAISLHAYATLADRYQILPHGASIGEGYGPMIVAPAAAPLTELKKQTIAIPGEKTTAYLVARIILGSFNFIVVPFDKIFSAVREGKADAGLIIHEGQLTYENEGLTCVLDLGAWWKERFNLPLPLGANAIRRDMPDSDKIAVSHLLRHSIAYSLSHREEALDYALGYARNMGHTLADRFVGMYVNDFTLDYGERGREAVRVLFEQGYRAGVLPAGVDVDFVVD